eukprot:TRINITY_DN11059_c0_g1_i1.p1 TRINITY_DN11059_c0_g1~~TRINITY_DN11059_c0_g1_i1.p1  ORF type:complete len:784 (+),score=202.81 TRINITY_DN11059_c0_g1_i1:229-2580(+)
MPSRTLRRGWLLAALIALNAICVSALRAPTPDDYDMAEPPRPGRGFDRPSADAWSVTPTPTVDVAAKLHALPAPAARAASPGSVSLTENRISFAQLVGRSSSAGVVLGLAANLSVFRSTDQMMTWSTTPASNVAFMAASPANPATLFFAGNWPSTTNWISRDLGATFQSIRSPSSFSRVLFHPTDPTWALASGISSSLYVTLNGASTWTPVLSSASVFDFDWCGAGTNGMPKSQICILMNGGGQGQPAWRSRMLAVTADFGGTFTPLLQRQVEYFLVHPRFIFAIATDCTSGTGSLFVCPLGSNTLTFTAAHVPNGVTVDRIAPEQFLDDSMGAVWLGVQTVPPSSGVPSHGDVYVSDMTGSNYARVFQHVFQQTNWWDLESVQSLPGVYLVNELVNWQEEDATNNHAVPLLKTSVTFNMGKSWQYLAPPINDSLGNPIVCTGPCSLNLFGVTTWIGAGGYGFFGHFYSNPLATGLILATGNVGPQIDFRPYAVNTYMSRDGGLTWVELMKGSFVYEYGDCGGILVLVRNQVLTNVAYYSLDEGLTLNAFNFTDNPVVVTNVWSTSASGKRFVISSSRPGAPTRIYIGLDFTGILENACGDADYEFWSPPGGNCPLGRTVTYKRRKQTSYCFNDDQQVATHVVNSTNCPCSVSDYECDFGYVQSSDGTCVPDPAVSFVRECAPDGTMWVSQGYRKIPFDSCVGDLPGYAPKQQSCTPSSSGSAGGDSHAVSAGGLVVIGLFVGLLVGVVAGAVGFWRFTIWRRNRHRGGYSRRDAFEEEPFIQ